MIPQSHASVPLGVEYYARLKRRVLFVGVLVIVAFAAASAVDMWRSHENNVELQERDLHNVANALAEQTSWKWQTIDVLLQDTGRWYMRDGRTMPTCLWGSHRAQRRWKRFVAMRQRSISC